MSLAWAALFTFYIITFPLNPLIFVLLFFNKQLVSLFASFRKDVVGPIPSPNCNFVVDPIWSRPHSTIVVQLTLDKHVSKEEAVEQVFQAAYNLKDRKGQRCYRELGYTPVYIGGYAFWKRVANFKIEDYVHVEESKSDLGSECLDDFVVSMVEKLQRKPFPKNAPLWECRLVHNSKLQPQKTLMFIRFHHMMADGISFIKFFYAVDGQYQLPENFTPPAASLQIWNRLGISAIWKKALKLTYLSTVGVVDYLHDMLIQKDRNGLVFDQSGRIKVTGAWICGMGQRLPVKLLKQASKRSECSMTPLILSAVSSGIERYMAQHHGNQLPKKFHYLAALPIPGHPDLRFVNHWSAVKLRAVTGFPDKLSRLKSFQEEATNSVNGSMPVVSAAMFQYVCGLLPAVLADMLTKFNGVCTALISNVVGPPDNHQLFPGAPVSSMVFWLPIGQECTGLAFGMISCNGGLRVCITADVGVIPDREQLQNLTKLIDAEIQSYF